MADKELPAPINSISESKRIWIINELGRTESKLAVQIKFKETWGQSLPDIVVDPIIESSGAQIQDLRNAYKRSIDSHEWGDARARMEKFKEYAEKAEQGLCKGVDRHGNTIIEEDLRLAADMVKECRNEQDRERKYGLALLDLMIKANKTPQRMDSGANTEGLEHVGEAGATVTDVEEAPTDTDQYFPDED